MSFFLSTSLGVSQIYFTFYISIIYFSKKEDDVDTDGVSVITDDEVEFSEEANENLKIEKDNPPSYTDEKIDIPSHGLSQEIKYPIPQYDQKEKCNNSDTASTRGSEEELCDEFFTSPSIRSYIHKRNNKLSSILNMILVGTVITTTCVAVGHVWGTTDDCTPDMFASLSQLVYNMQELQHENHILKSKIKLLESKNYRGSQLPASYYQLDNYKKISQYYADLNSKDAEDDFIKQEKTVCECVKNDDGIMVAENITEIVDNAVPLTNENFNDVLVDSLNKNDQLPNAFEALGSLRSEKFDEYNKVYKKPMRKRSISSYHVHNYVDPKAFDETFVKEDSNLQDKSKHFNYPKNNASNLNKKHIKERRKQEKYLRESSDGQKLKKNKKYTKTEAMNFDDKDNFKHHERKYKNEPMYVESNEKFKIKNYKNSRKDKYKMKGFKVKKDENFPYNKDQKMQKDENIPYNKDQKMKKDENFQYRDHKTKRDDKKENYATDKEKRYLKI